MRSRRRNATRSFYPQVRHEVGPRVAAWMDADELRALRELEHYLTRYKPPGPAWLSSHTQGGLATPTPSPAYHARAMALAEVHTARARLEQAAESAEILADVAKAVRGGHRVVKPSDLRVGLVFLDHRGEPRWQKVTEVLGHGGIEVVDVDERGKVTNPTGYTTTVDGGQTTPKAKTKPRAAPSPPGALPAGFDSFGFDVAPPTGPVEIPGFERVSAAWPRGHTLKFGANRPRTYTITDVDMGAKTERKLPRGTTAVHPEGFFAVRRTANVKPAVTHEGRRHDWASLLISGDSIEVRVDAYLPADASGHVNKGSRLLGTTYVNPPETTTKPKPKAKPKTKATKPAKPELWRTSGRNRAWYIPDTDYMIRTTANSSGTKWDAWHDTPGKAGEERLAHNVTKAKAKRAILDRVGGKVAKAKTPSRRVVTWATQVKEATTYPKWKALYAQTLKTGLSYSPGQAGGSIYMERAAELADLHPEWVERFEAGPAAKAPKVEHETLPVKAEEAKPSRWYVIARKSKAEAEKLAKKYKLQVEIEEVPREVALAGTDWDSLRQFRTPQQIAQYKEDELKRIQKHYLYVRAIIPKTDHAIVGKAEKKDGAIRIATVPGLESVWDKARIKAIDFQRCDQCRKGIRRTKFYLYRPKPGAPIQQIGGQCAKHLDLSAKMRAQLKGFAGWAKDMGAGDLDESALFGGRRRVSRLPMPFGLAFAAVYAEQHGFTSAKDELNGNKQVIAYLYDAATTGKGHPSARNEYARLAKMANPTRTARLLKQAQAFLDDKARGKDPRWEVERVFNTQQALDTGAFSLLGYLAYLPVAMGISAAKKEAKKRGKATALPPVIPWKLDKAEEGRSGGGLYQWGEWYADDSLKAVAKIGPRSGAPIEVSMLGWLKGSARALDTRVASMTQAEAEAKLAKILSGSVGAALAPVSVRLTVSNLDDVGEVAHKLIMRAGGAVSGALRKSKFVPVVTDQDLVKLYQGTTAANRKTILGLIGLDKAAWDKRAAKVAAGKKGFTQGHKSKIKGYVPGRWRVIDKYVRDGDYGTTTEYSMVGISADVTGHGLKVKTSGNLGGLFRGITEDKYVDKGGSSYVLDIGTEGEFGGATWSAASASIGEGRGRRMNRATFWITGFKPPKIAKEAERPDWMPPKRKE